MNPSQTDDSALRALIRLIPPARALRDQLEKSIHLDIYAGTGDQAVRSLQALQEAAARAGDDPYLSALALSVADSLGDREKVSAALLAATQLCAYLEGQTGLGGYASGTGGNINIQKAPMISLNNVEGVPGIEKILDVVNKPVPDGG